ncbi:MAG TPA: secretin and TonB N-terminal domain-containing protein [Nitrosomonas sp.]|nr:secretin and TonB N-terminal domain-containing protein [Nitrosomonas sp.]HMW19898.1 secretin and TonB N-terminal domain-containing protein [Nitrosomonas sp.]HMW68707.1 secretin and TonB N-terminal domain-containing protein [Nitrosomonas sp.]HMY60837.1 secretin and TonB N-terminal domain-containing protein [Nitrosomonas sp.]HMY89226.1 secretin and TonB N-terminal domain-containing protein [Nitrosomonas sp.]
MRLIGYLLSIVLVLSGCATFTNRNEAFLEGKQLIAQGQLDAGLKKLEQAAYEEPGSKEIRAVLFRERETIINKTLFEADKLLASDNLDAAEKKYRRVLEIKPNEERARDGLDALNLSRYQSATINRAKEMLDRNDVEGAEAAVRAVLQENPYHEEARLLVKRLNEHIARAEEPVLALVTAFNNPITMEFRDTALKTIFELISKTAGINFIFDKTVQQDSKTSIFVRNNRIEDVLKLLLMTNQLAYKILNDNTLLIYPDTPAKQKDYQELVVRSFHVANTDVKQMVAMIRGLVKAKDIYVNEKLNLFVIRDTLEAIRLVERLVAINDFPDPEVMLDIEVLELSRTRVMELGPKLPQSVTFSGVPGVGDATVAGVAKFSAIGAAQSTSDGLRNFTVNNQVIIDFKKTLTVDDILANPRIRVKNREKAKILLGDKIPIFQASATATGVISQNVTYLDVGLKVEVEPIISFNNEVSVKVALEVSTLGASESSGTTRAFRIGTRSAETLLSSKDGETQVLAGLIRDNDRKGFAGLAGLIDLPVIGRLFTSHSFNRESTEIILLITPYVMRNITQPTKLESEFYSGTAAAAGKLPATIRKTAPKSLAITPAGAGSASAAFSAPMLSDDTEAIPNPFAAAAQANPATPTLSLQAPATIAMDKEFTATIRLMTQNTKLASELELVYDKGMLEMLDGGEKSGSRTLKLGREEPNGMTAVLRFKAVSPNPGSTNITVQSISTRNEKGESVDVDLPSPAIIEIQ